MNLWLTPICCPQTGWVEGTLLPIILDTITELIHSGIRSLLYTWPIQLARHNKAFIQLVEEVQTIDADLICKTIDTKFEQGLLMFKELAQSNSNLDFETKEQIFNKLISIVA